MVFIMSDIKAVIQLLCQHLNVLLKANLKPENFRLAKFNNNDRDTISELWSTLSKLCKAVGPCVPNYEKYNVRLWVQLELALRGYNSLQFFSLSHDSCESRELLLALTWIIAKEDVLNFLTREYVRQSPFCQEYSDAANEQVLKCADDLQHISAEFKKKMGPQDQINYCLWLANRIKYNFNQILDAEHERVRKTHKVHEASNGASGLPHLSAFETKLVHDPIFLEQSMPHFLKLNELLETHTKWLKKKAVFWEWMNTIVEIKVREYGEDYIQSPQQRAVFEKFFTIFQNCLQEIKSKDTPTASSSVTIPRFFLSSSFAKSASTLVRKASSSDLLSEEGKGDNGVAIHASDLLACVNSELQEMEKQKVDKMRELNRMLQSLSGALGVVAIGELVSVDTESEDCSK